MFGTEIQIHHYFLQSKLRTLDSSETDFFYVPIYGSIIFPRLVHYSRMLISTQYVVWWNRTQGMDYI